MKPLLIASLVALTACASPALPTPEPEKRPGMFVTNAEAQQCTDGDGCVLVTKDEIRRVADVAFEKGRRAGTDSAKEDCWANTSWGGR